MAKPVVGSLSLGLHDAEGLLHHVGFTSSLPSANRPEITRRLRKLIALPGFTAELRVVPAAGMSANPRSGSLYARSSVAEVRYDHFAGHRFRHGTRFLRWRPDKAPKQCRIDQVQTTEASPLALSTLRRTTFSGLPRTTPCRTRRGPPCLTCAFPRMFPHRCSEEKFPRTGRHQ